MDGPEPGEVGAPSSLFEATNVEDVERGVILRAHATSRALGFSFPDSFPCDALSLGYCLQNVRREILRLSKAGPGERLDFVRVKEQMLLHLQQNGTERRESQVGAEADAVESASRGSEAAPGGPPSAPAETRRAELIRKGLLTPFDEVENDEELISKGLMTPLDAMAGKRPRYDIQSVYSPSRFS
jgi:hypothetical protein